MVLAPTVLPARLDVVGLEALRRSLVRIAGQDEVVAVALLLHTAREEIEHPHEGGLGLGGRHPQAVAPHRNAVRSLWKKPSSAA